MTNHWNITHETAVNRVNNVRQELKVQIGVKANLKKDKNNRHQTKSLVDSNQLRILLIESNPQVCQALKVMTQALQMEWDYPQIC